jgi:hypothetical protein
VAQLSTLGGKCAHLKPQPQKRKNMKTLRVLFVGLAMLATVFTASAGDDKSSGQHWYQVVVAQPGYYAFVGSSALSESDLAAALSKEDGFIKLDHLLYRDNTGKYKDWHEWDPTAQSCIYIHTKSVITFQPLVGDPSKGADTGSK